MACYIMATKYQSDATRARRFYEKHGIPCWVMVNKTTFVLFTNDEARARQAKELRGLPLFRTHRHR